MSQHSIGKQYVSMCILFNITASYWTILLLLVALVLCAPFIFVGFIVSSILAYYTFIGIGVFISYLCRKPQNKWTCYVPKERIIQ